MSAEALERFEMIMAVGIMVIAVLAYVAMAIACFVVSSKKKKTDPKDSKTWKTLGIILICTGGVALIGAGVAIVVPMLLYEAGSMAVFIM